MNLLLLLLDEVILLLDIGQNLATEQVECLLLVVGDCLQLLEETFGGVWSLDLHVVLVALALEVIQLTFAVF